MVEGIACRSLDRLNQLSVAVGDKDTLVGGVVFSCKFFARFSGEVEEGGALGSVLGKGCVAGLSRVIPDDIIGFVRCR